MVIAGERVHDVILREGRTLRLRPPTGADAAALLEFLRGLSADTLYLRFHGMRVPDERMVEPYLDADWNERGVLVGTLADADGGERIVALTEFSRLRDVTTAEAAFVVADELQGRGIGTRLLERLAAEAASVGVERFVAEVLPENSLMLAVFRDAGFAVTRRDEGGNVEMTFEIAETQGYLQRVDERDHRAIVSSLEPFFAPRSVAVVGASRRRGTIGGELFRNILQADFTGAAYPVNPRGEPVAGVRSVPSVADLPEVVDLAVICLPGERVLPVAEEVLRAGTRALCIISAGFAEVGPEGERRQEQLLSLVRAHGARLVGPNCLGIAVSGPRLNATFAPAALPPGNVAFSSQSGALGLAMLQKAQERNLGFSAFVSIGNKADVSSNDLLEHWEDDPETAVVMLYLESFGNPRKFGRLARRVSRSKPVLAMKSGTTQSGRKAASSHTAALAGSEAAVDALFHQAGVMRARTLGELTDAAVLFSSQPLPRGRRVAVMTNAGGLGILCADACEAAGLQLVAPAEETQRRLREVLPIEASVENPIDMLGSATGASYAAALPIVMDDPHVDSLIVLFVPPVVAGAAEVAHAIAGAVDGSPQTEKPVLACVLASGGVPVELRQGRRPVASFAYPESAARALGIAADRADWLRRPAGAVPELDRIDHGAAREIVEDALRLGDGLWLEPAHARALLAAYGIPVVGETTAADPDGAAAAAAEIGFPVVVKTAAAGAHKTETGGVVLDLGDGESVRAAARRIGGPVIVQRMVRGGVELLAGVVQDPVFGPLVAFGPGGVFAELIGDAGFRIAPLTDLDAQELVLGGKAGRLVRGYRGGPEADVASLTDLLHRLARLADDVPEVAELDLNPVIADGDGCMAVDARVRLQRPQRSRREKTW
jgi:acetate---CoA ligase (ADP-forming)